MADRRNALQLFAEAIAGLGQGPSARWREADESASRSAIGALLLSRETIGLSQAEASWGAAFDAAVEVYARTASAEARLLAENFPGLLLWRVAVTLERSSWRGDVKRAQDLVAAVGGPDVVAKLTQNNLRVTAAYGPANVRSALREWLTEFAEVAESATSRDAANLVESGEANDAAAAPTADSFTERLTARRYEYVYPFPLVQEGLRFLAASVGWRAPFSLFYSRTRDPDLKPLTRALFAIGFVDQYFWQVKDAPPRGIVDRFAADADALDSSALMSPSEANATKRTNYEVRVSSAVSYGDPFIRGASPGISSARVRTDAGVFLPDGPLDREAFCIHVAAVLRLLRTPGSADRIDPRADRDAKLALADSAGAALEAVQRAQSMRQLIERLIRAGFTPTTCLIYDSALRAEFARGNYYRSGSGLPAIKSGSSRGSDEDDDELRPRGSSRDRRDGPFEFDEAQQAVGCVAAIGKAAFGLAESYGPGTDYLDSFTFATGSDLDDSADFHAALGLPEGAISGVLGRSMPPRAFPEYARSARAAWMAEADESEKIVSSKSGRGATRVNSAREALALWFDRLAEERWGIVEPRGALAAPPHTSPAAFSPAGAETRDSVASTSGVAGNNTDPRSSSASPSVSPAVEAIFIEAAASVAYPQPVSETRPELRSPAFAEYVVATAAADALSALASASFTAPHIAASLDIVAWARDYGGPDVGNFEDHRGKLNAILYSLLPFSGNDPQPPTSADAANVESLMSELHAVVVSAIDALPPRARPRAPPKPSAANSAFLLSMYVTAARMELDALVARTDALTAAVSAIAWSVADSAWTLKAFFEAEFFAAGGGAVTVKSHGEILGVWSAADLSTAVAETYADCADAVAEARVLAVNLRALAQETDRARDACVTLAARAAAERTAGEPSARVYATLAADHTALRDVQTSLDGHLRRMTAGTTPPGIGAVARDLEAIRGLDAIAVSAEDPRGRFAASVAAAVAAWKVASVAKEEDAATAAAADKERKSRVPETPADQPTRSEIATAVKTVAEDARPAEADAIAPGAVEISSRFNVADPSDLDGRPLLFGAYVPRTAADLATDELILVPRVTAATLTDLADAILNEEAFGGRPSVPLALSASPTPVVA